MIVPSLASVAVTLTSVKAVPAVVVNVWSVEFNTGAVVSETLVSGSLISGFGLTI